MLPRVMGTKTIPEAGGAEGKICEHVLARINEFLDHELDDDVADEVRRHLAECEQCSDEAEIWSMIRQVVKRSYHPEPAPPALIDRITRQLHDLRCRDGETV